MHDEVYLIEKEILHTILRRQYAATLTFDLLLGQLDVGQHHINHAARLLTATVPRILGQGAHDGVQHRRGPVESCCGRKESVLDENALV